MGDGHTVSGTARCFKAELNGSRIVVHWTWVGFELDLGWTWVGSVKGKSYLNELILRTGILFEKTK